MTSKTNINLEQSEYGSMSLEEEFRERKKRGEHLEWTSEENQVESWFQQQCLMDADRKKKLSPNGWRCRHNYMHYETRSQEYDYGSMSLEEEFAKRRERGEHLKWKSEEGLIEAWFQQQLFMDAVEKKMRSARQCLHKISKKKKEKHLHGRHRQKKQNKLLNRSKRKSQLNRRTDTQEFYKYAFLFSVFFPIIVFLIALFV